MISRNCEIIPICLCNGVKKLRFTLGIANKMGDSGKENKLSNDNAHSQICKWSRGWAFLFAFT